MLLSAPAGRGLQTIRRSPAFTTFDIVLLDPPYEMPATRLCQVDSLIAPDSSSWNTQKRTDVPSSTYSCLCTRRLVSETAPWPFTHADLAVYRFLRPADQRARGYHPRVAPVFDRIVVAIRSTARNRRCSRWTSAWNWPAGLQRHSNVEVDTFDGLLVDYVNRRGARLSSGGCAISDFEFEFQMALMNRRLNGRIETIFLMPAEQYLPRARLIKEVCQTGRRCARPGACDRGRTPPPQARRSRAMIPMVHF